MLHHLVLAGGVAPEHCWYLLCLEHKTSQKLRHCCLSAGGRIEVLGAHRPPPSPLRKEARLCSALGNHPQRPPIFFWGETLLLVAREDSSPLVTSVVCSSVSCESIPPSSCPLCSQWVILCTKSDLIDTTMSSILVCVAGASPATSNQSKSRTQSGNLRRVELDSIENFSKGWLLLQILLQVCGFKARARDDISSQSIGYHATGYLPTFGITCIVLLS